MAWKNPFGNATMKNNVDKEDNQGSWKSVKPVLSSMALALCTLTMFQSPAFAAKAAAQEHLHIGQKIAQYFMSFGLPKWAVLATISAMPVVELRGAIPVGIWMGLPISTVLPICVVGNMTPIIPLLFLLRNEQLKYVCFFVNFVLGDSCTGKWLKAYRFSIKFMASIKFMNEHKVTSLFVVFGCPINALLSPLFAFIIICSSRFEQPT